MFIEVVALNRTLRFLGLAGCELGKIGTSEISEAIRENTSLTTLDLADNYIKPEYASELARALRQNRFLHNIRLIEGNNIGGPARRELMQAIRER
mmetsp:Transcript_1791/g.4011  ORF Transcript_1791/g.4011 Transcript_1791/m.4011 type:complete len:95 (-) Transcript_1791:88-372(-)